MFSIQPIGSAPVASSWGAASVSPAGYAPPSEPAEPPRLETLMAAKAGLAPSELPNLTLQAALRQINVLGQSGIGREHVGILFVFGQYAAKAVTLEAAMQALWLSPDYATLAGVKRDLWLGGDWMGGVDVRQMYTLPEAAYPRLLAPPAALGQMVDFEA